METFYVSGKKNGESQFIGRKRKTLVGILKYAARLEKEGWEEVWVIHDKSNNVVYDTSWQKAKSQKEEEK